MNQAAQREIGGGRYLLVRPIASGGMGTIWQGHDTRLNRTVAVKEVSLDLVPPVHRTEFLERAAHEGRNAAALADHPNIVTVHDVVIEDGVPWTVMQYVRGRSLAGVLEAGPLPADRVAVLAGQMLSALGFAHEAGIVHRDVKPLNIMINDADGRALLTDFGIAKNSGDADLTRSGTIIGSAPYMAPERHEGEPAGPPSDLFGLGVSLFEAAEGYSPFARESRTGTVTAILVKPLPELRRAGALAPLITGLCEKDPSRRLSVAQAKALLNSVSTAPAITLAETVADPPLARTQPADHVWQPPARSSRSTRTLPVVLAAVAVAAATVLAITLWPRAISAGTTATHTQAANSVELSGHTATVNTVAFSPDGTLLASGSNDDTVRLWNTATKHLIAILPASAPVTSLAFSPDGKSLVTDGSNGDQALLWNLASRRVTATFSVNEPVVGVAFSPDGATVAVGSEDTAINLWNVHTGRPGATFTTYDASGVTALAFSPDGRSLATFTASCYLQIWNLADGQGTIPPPGVDGSESAQISPDGSTLANGSHNGADGKAQVQLWSTTTANSTGTFDFSGAPHLGIDQTYTGGDVVHIAYSPNGGLLAAGADDGRVQVWNLTTNLTASTFTVGANIHSIAFSPDGKTLAIGLSGGGVQLTTLS